MCIKSHEYDRKEISIANITHIIIVTWQKAIILSARILKLKKLIQENMWPRQAMVTAGKSSWSFTPKETITLARQRYHSIFSACYSTLSVLSIPSYHKPINTHYGWTSRSRGWVLRDTTARTRGERWWLLHRYRYESHLSSRMLCALTNQPYRVWDLNRWRRWNPRWIASGSYCRTERHYTPDHEIIHQQHHRHCNKLGKEGIIL